MKKKNNLSLASLSFSWHSQAKGNRNSALWPVNYMYTRVSRALICIDSVSERERKYRLWPYSRDICYVRAKGRECVVIKEKKKKKKEMVLFIDLIGSLRSLNHAAAQPLKACTCRLWGVNEDDGFSQPIQFWAFF